MAEPQVNFLIKASSVLSHIQCNETQKILRSYYLMQCKKLSGISGLPQKHFSQETRCSHCLLEWKKGTEIRLKPIKLSKRQRQRIKLNSKVQKNSRNKEYLLYSNEMEKVCSFCRHNTKTTVNKPSKLCQQPKIEHQKCVENTNTSTIVNRQKKLEKNQKTIDKYETNVYCKSKDAFSLSKQTNTLPNHVKELPKIIKNNKKKKDRFAGLSQIAVVAAAKLKQEKDKHNKLNMFLKPAK